MTSPRFDPGSFRDRESRVALHQERILRLLSPEALASWNALRESRSFERAVAGGRIVGTKRPPDATELLAAFPGWAGILEHERVPFVSYPYEWSFSMLQDAAILQLELLLEALDDGLTLKDASAYNVQWRGAQPVFVDVGSFERYVPGEPWVGYLQFCQLFLYPLLLTSHRGVPFQPFLRGSLDGIPVAAMTQLFSARDWLRPGVFADVFLHAKLQAGNAASRTAVRREVRRSGFSREMIATNVRRLLRIVSGMRWKLASSEWSEYASDNSYDAADAEAKKAFVTKAAATRRWRRVWDLGANTGTFARIAAEHADYTVAMDSDALSVDRLFRELRAEKRRDVLPLVANVVDPSPGLGWRGRERLPAGDRGRPDLTLCLALLHHLVLGGNVPLGEVVDWLAEPGGHLVIEFVAKGDPMAEKLLLNKLDNYADYDRDEFERLLGLRFELLDRLELRGGLRTLYFARPTGTAREASTRP
ncbi:MAG: class I SAM-dependent methyltransferase [Thermoanaerobaculia bacterium]|jgi:SAM-dependent methyltransferase